MSGSVISQRYMHPRLGEIAVRTLSTARRFSGRVRGGIVHVTVPRGVSADEFTRALDSMEPALQRALRRSASPYCHGYRFATSGWSFELVRSEDILPVNIRSTVERTPDGFHITFAYGTELDFSDPSHAKFMSSRISDRARDYTQLHIVPEALRIADELGCRQAEIKVSRGLRVLGHCSSSGVVALSEKIAFLPADLRRYIITHELAHLSHMNHSAAFYALWEQYMGCPVRPMRKRLRGFVWPVQS